MSVRLPDKPSELIRLALADLEKVEADPAFEIDMDVWFIRRRLRPVCAVCQAGAVMAMTLNAERTREHYPRQWDQDTALKLLALNDFRAGWVHDGLETMHIDPPDSLPNEFRDFPAYATDPAAYKAVMREMADQLEGAGL